MSCDKCVTTSPDACRKPRPKRLYISGQMSGIPELNFPLFNKVAADFRSMGYDVVNPAELDAGLTTETREYYMRRDLALVPMCDVLVHLEGWEKSRGAKAENFVACECGLEHWYKGNAKTVGQAGLWPDGHQNGNEARWLGNIVEPVKEAEPPRTGRPTLQEFCESMRNVRMPGIKRHGPTSDEMVNPVTMGEDAPILTNAAGGMQSALVGRLELIPAAAWLEVGKVFAYGAKKYKRDNWKLISAESHLGHMLQHAAGWMMGDQSEDHPGHLVCRAMMFLDRVLAGHIRDMADDMTDGEKGAVELTQKAKDLLDRIG